MLLINISLQSVNPISLTLIGQLVPLTNSFSDHSFSFKKILPNNVFFALCQLKDNTSAGPEGLEVKFVKLAACLDVSPC